MSVELFGYCYTNVHDRSQRRVQWMEVSKVGNGLNIWANIRFPQQLCKLEIKMLQMLLALFGEQLVSWSKVFQLASQVQSWL